MSVFGRERSECHQNILGFFSHRILEVATKEIYICTIWNPLNRGGIWENI